MLSAPPHHLFHSTLSPPPSQPQISIISRQYSTNSWTPLSHPTMTTLSIPHSPSLVDWTLMNPLLSGQLPPPSSSLTPWTSPTTCQCRQVTCLYGSPVHQEDHIVLSSINPTVLHADPSVRNLEDPPTIASVGRKHKPLINSNMFPWCYVLPALTMIRL